MARPRAAHLVGGITAMPDDAPFPPTKDVDIHLVFADGSPALRPGTVPDLIEVAYDGIADRGGLSNPLPTTLDAATVLANPEIAYHLDRETSPFTIPAATCATSWPMRSGRVRPAGVRPRPDRARAPRASTRAVALRRWRARYGAVRRVEHPRLHDDLPDGHSAVATLSPPKIGGRTFVNLRDQLVGLGRLDLHGGCARATSAVLRDRSQAPNALLEDGRRGVRPGGGGAKRRRTTFQHKLHAHLRPYFVDACRAMIDEGYDREALGWVTPFFLSATDVILADGPEAERPVFAARQAAFLRELGFATAQERAAKWAHAHRLYDRVFALAAETVATHPGIVDEPVRRHATFERLAA